MFRGLAFILVESRGLGENAHLRRYPHPSSLRRTSRYASFQRISEALHLGIFTQPPNYPVFRLVRRRYERLNILSKVEGLLAPKGMK